MPPRRAILFLIMILGWTSLVAQWVLHRQASPEFNESVVRFFSFFTVLTNLLVASLATFQLLTPEKRRNGLFFSPSFETAVTLYITLVGLVYNLLLRQLWDSHGLQAILHDMLHTVIPVLMLIYWWNWVDTRRLSYRDIYFWMIYPVAYSVIILIRGHFANWYPYPFLDVLRHGLSHVLRNSLLLLLTFVIFSFGFVAIGKKKTYH